MGETIPVDPLALAADAHALVDVDAGRAAGAAAAALDQARGAGSREAEVAALHARGFALLRLGDQQATATLRAAVRAAERYGLTHRAALARRTLAGALAGAGAISAALRELDAAAGALDGLERARLEVFRVGIMCHAGYGAESVGSSDAALAMLRARRDVLWEARLLRNRGIWLRKRGDTEAAEREFTRARHLFVGLGASGIARDVEIELALIALLQGSLPECLARLDAIDSDQLAPRSRAELELLRANALASGRLTDEALRSLAAAQTLWEQAGIDDEEGRIDAIRLTLLMGGAPRARELARAAQRSFAAQRRSVLAARVAGLALAAQVATGTLTVSSLRSGQRAAAVLAGDGWHSEACRVRLTTALAAVTLDRPGIARRELAACEGQLRRAPLADRIEALRVRALIRLGDGDSRGAQSDARRGLSLLDQHRAALGAADLRATSSSIGAELATLGLSIALADPRPWPTLAWADAIRANATRLTPVTPPRNRELRAALIELRQIVAEITRTEGTGRPVRSLRARQAQLETRVRRIARHAAGEDLPSRMRLNRQVLTTRLGERALVEFVAADGELSAVTLVAGRLRRHTLGPLAPVQEQLEWLRFALQRLAHLRRDAPQRSGLLAGGQASANELERALIAPLLAAIGDREVVLVPTGALHLVPWAALPALRGRPVTLAPAAGLWCALQARPPGRAARVVLVAGPRLRQARREITAIGALRPGAVSLTGAEATAAATLRALDGAAVAHLACHGRARDDSPLFSALELADGPLHAYDLQRLKRPPELVVLSACDLGSARTHPGDELLGLASTLLDLGTRNVVASVVAVPDAGAARLMTGLHREMAAGLPPAAALARAQAAAGTGDLPLTGFIALGAG